MAMRATLAVLAAALLCSVAAPKPAAAASVRGVIHCVEARVEGAIFAAHVRAASREWKELPKAEVACVDQGLRERGQSVEALARRGVSPSNPRLAEVRKQCSAAASMFDAGKIPTRAAMQAAAQQGGTAADLRTEQTDGF